MSSGRVENRDGRIEVDIYPTEVSFEVEDKTYDDDKRHVEVMFMTRTSALIWAQSLVERLRETGE
jgi:hypothetical protein